MRLQSPKKFFRLKLLTKNLPNRLTTLQLFRKFFKNDLKFKKLTHHASKILHQLITPQNFHQAAKKFLKFLSNWDLLILTSNCGRLWVSNEIYEKHHTFLGVLVLMHKSIAFGQILWPQLFFQKRFSDFKNN